MRVIINFFIYGFIFFLIYLFFPEAFTTLVSWAWKVYDFFRELILKAQEKIQGEPVKPAEETQKAIFFLCCFLRKNSKSF